MDDSSPRRCLAAIERVSEPEAVELQKFPYPYRAAFTVASDIDSASMLRFRAVHALFCKRGLIRRNSPEWLALGLNTKSAWYDQELDGVEGLGLNIADSFFLVADPTTFGMYRPNPSGSGFVEDREEEEGSCEDFIKRGVKTGEIDCFHAFLHYRRAEIAPLLKKFYSWCEAESAPKPAVWINHSLGVTPSGLCPDELQPNRLNRLARLLARRTIGPLLGRDPQPIRHAFVRYQGDSPGSPYYINDQLFANGLKFVWLNQNDLHANRIDLPEQAWRGRSTILQTVAMDDGTRYHRFERCYGKDPGSAGQAYLRTSKHGCDASCLITEPNLRHLCSNGGTCILYTHWTHYRSQPISDETIGRFHLLAQWHSAGKVWVAPTSELLEWTRRRTFLDFTCSKGRTGLLVEIKGVDDPNFGYQRISFEQAHGICFRASPTATVSVALNGRLLSPEHIQREGDLFWLSTNENKAVARGKAAPFVQV